MEFIIQQKIQIQMNNIVIKQNEHKQLERLAAQRELYSSAKKYHGWQIILVVFIPLILSFIILPIEHIAEYAAAYGLIIAIVDLFYFDEKIKYNKNKAVKIQEMFDCDVLEMECSPLKTVKDITVEEVLTLYDAHIKKNTNIENIVDWYKHPIEEVPIAIGRVIGQRANLSWDSKLRNTYTNLLNTTLWVVIFFIFGYALVKNLEFISIVLLGSTLLPFFQFTIKQYLEQKETVKRLSELMNFVNGIWDLILEKSKSDEQLTESSRRLQDEIFEHRNKSPLILDFFYNRFREKDETILSQATQQLVDDLRNKGVV